MEDDKDKKLGWPEAIMKIVEYVLTTVVICFVTYCIFLTGAAK